MDALHPPYRFSATIVLYHSSLPLLTSTLESLAGAVGTARVAGLIGEAEVTLVDHSGDGAYRSRLESPLQRLSSLDAYRLSYREEPENRGFGAGHNSVLGRLGSDFHLVLNPDVELAPDALQVGLSRMRDNPRIALLSPRVTGERGEQEFLCKRYPSALVLLLRAFAPGLARRFFRRTLDDYEMRDVCSGRLAAEVPLASGCFMLVPTSVLCAEGGFDERYFLYFEDFDLSLRLARHGLLLYEPDMRIVHHGGYAARKGVRHVGYFVRSGIRFFNDHGWRWF